jgi:hypothetical protein
MPEHRETSGMGVMRWLPRADQYAGQDPAFDDLIAQLRRQAEEDHASAVWSCTLSRIGNGRYRVELTHGDLVAGRPEQSTETRESVRFSLEGSREDVLTQFAMWLSIPWKQEV